MPEVLKTPEGVANSLNPGRGWGESTALHKHHQSPGPRHLSGQGWGPAGIDGAHQMSGRKGASRQRWFWLLCQETQIQRVRWGFRPRWEEEKSRKKVASTGTFSRTFFQLQGCLWVAPIGQKDHLIEVRILVPYSNTIIYYLLELEQIT